MKRLIGYYGVTVLSLGVVTACSPGGPPDRQRPVYGFQNVDMRPDESGYDSRQNDRSLSDETPSSTHEAPSGRR